MKFQEFVNRNLPPEIYRAKGFLDFGSKGHKRKYIFQLVGTRPEIVWENWRATKPETKLVFIGRDVDTKKLKKSLEACVDTDPTGQLPNGIELQLPKKAEL